MKLAVMTCAALLAAGCAFDPICEPGEPECDFAEEPKPVNMSDTSMMPEDSGSDNGVDSGPPDVTDMSEPVPNPSQCPAVSTCGNEPDHIDKNLVWDEPFGCASDFQSRTITIEDGLCDGDSDWHGVWVAGCENRSFVIEAIVKPATPACLPFMRINIADEDGFRVCGARAARCEQLPDGSLRASLLVQAREDRGSDAFFFVIDSTSETDAPYTITVSAFQ